MNDKNLIHKIQSDLTNSKAKIINNNDNTSEIKKNFSSKYTENISDSEDELISYKNRNNKILSDLPSINSSKSLSQIKKINKSSKALKKETTKLDLDSIKLKQFKLDNKNENGNGKGKGKKYTDPDPDPDPNVDNVDNVDNADAVDADDDEFSEPEYEYSEEFKKKVKDYVKNDDRIRELQTELKTLNSAKKAAETEILKHLERLGESNININGGKLRINQYESKEGLKEDLIKEALSEKIKDPKIIEFIFEKINEKRVANGKIQKSLKRTFERGGKNDKK